MTVWVLVCTECGAERKLDVGYDLRELGKVYLYCRNCGKNSFHEVVRVEE